MTIEVINDKLRAGEIVIIDGTTGTELRRRGPPMHKGSWCALATESHTDVLRAIHGDYIHAGADLITAWDGSTPACRSSAVVAAPGSSTSRS